MSNVKSTKTDGGSKSAFEPVKLPLSKLVRSRNNPRKIGGESIDDLVASISAHGLIHNLTVVEVDGGKYEVKAGSRRLAALLKLTKQKKLPKDFRVPCKIVTSGEAAEIALAENAIRQAMHPADQFDAFRSLVDDGLGIEEVAARFGVTANTVRQRLKLANVAPRLFQLYRDNEITLDQLMALAVCDDHAAQERVWDAAARDWQREPQALREALTESKIDAATDRRARFVGVEAFSNAGGQIERDLFQPEHEGYLTDSALLDRLTGEKLDRLAEEVRAEGWKWVEIQPEADYSFLATFGRIYPVRVKTPAIEAEIKSLEEEQDRINETHREAEAYPADAAARLAEIENRIDELNDQATQFRKKEKGLAGAFVAIESNGQARIHRGLVRREDKGKAKAVKSGDDSENGTGVDAGEESEEETHGLSGALVEDLTAHRTAALRAVLATRPDVALVAAAHNLALQVCYVPSYESPSALSLKPDKGACQLDRHAKGIETSLAQKTLSGLHAQWLKRIPADPDALWDWLLKQDQSVVADLLAYCVGQTVNAVRLPHESASQARFVAADRLAAAVNLDMADWWTATGESYLGRVKKDQAITAISEATGDNDLEDLRKLKKAELVATAERRLAEKRWLPEILRR